MIPFGLMSDKKVYTLLKSSYLRYCNGSIDKEEFEKIYMKVYKRRKYLAITFAKEYELWESIPKLDIPFE